MMSEVSCMYLKSNSLGFQSTHFGGIERLRCGSIDRDRETGCDDFEREQTVRSISLTPMCP